MQIMKQWVASTNAYNETMSWLNQGLVDFNLLTASLPINSKPLQLTSQTYNWLKPFIVDSNCYDIKLILQ